MTTRPTPLLDRVLWPRDLKNLTVDELATLSDELRTFLIDSVSKTGGHFASGLGTVELTVALHYVFDTPRDLLVWDVSHQCYPHKLLTGRFERFDTLRTAGGLAGYTRRAESAHDPFGASHGSTSISAALGFAVARDLRGGDEHVVAVIGDGALTGGLAYEGLNNAGELQKRLIVVLNDNEMSIARNVGAIARYLTKLTTSRIYRRFERDVWDLLGKLPPGLRDEILSRGAGATGRLPLPTAEEAGVLDSLSADAATSVDALVEATNRPVTEVLALLLSLEVKGLIAAGPGACFRRRM